MTLLEQTVDRKVNSPLARIQFRVTTECKLMCAVEFIRQPTCMVYLLINYRMGGANCEVTKK